MGSAKLSCEEVFEIIFYAIKKNGYEVRDINGVVFRKILNKYRDLSIDFKNKYVDGELDTFKYAACLLVAINRSELVEDKRLKASIAVAAAYKMCEKPYWNFGENNDIPSKLEEVDFDDFKLDANYCYEHATNMMIDSLVYGDGEPIDYFLNLELFYQAALTNKDNQKKIIKSMIK